jgi:enoyl-CoA hydratase
MTVLRNEPDGPAIIVEHLDSIAIVRLNRPDNRNALSILMLTELGNNISALTQRKDIKTIILTGTGTAFASGANINEIAALNPGTAKEFAKFGQSVFGRIASARQKTIAAINGYCIGGGLDLSLVCDYRCASTNAVFAHPGARLGIITGWGGTQRLPRVIGTARALELFTTARHITSQEALEIGLIHKIGEPVLTAAMEFV